MDWFSSGVKVDPISDEILVDTLTLHGGEVFDLRLLLAATVNIIVALEWQDVTNTVTRAVQFFPVSANEILDITLHDLNVDAGERLRVRTAIGVSGLASCSLIKQ